MVGVELMDDIFDTVYQARIEEAVRMTRKIRFLLNKGVLPQKHYRECVDQIREHLGIKTNRAEHEAN